MCRTCQLSKKVTINPQKKDNRTTSKAEKNLSEALSITSRSKKRKSLCDDNDGVDLCDLCDQTCVMTASTAAGHSSVGLSLQISGVKVSTIVAMVPSSSSWSTAACVFTELVLKDKNLKFSFQIFAWIPILQSSQVITVSSGAAQMSAHIHSAWMENILEM